MPRHYPIDKSKYASAPAKDVTYCPKCKAPVVVKPGAMEEHINRIHTHWGWRPILDKS